MPTFRDDNIVVVSPGSETTQATIGLGESLSPPTIQIPTKVYRHASNPKMFSSKGTEENAVYPVKKGRIVDVDAFGYLLKLIYRLAQSQLGSHAAVPMLLLSCCRWDRFTMERITQYAFETIKVTGFTIIPSALAATYAHGLSDSLVIDVGKEKTEITPINEFQVVEHARQCVDYGGQTINESLSKLLPDLDAGQVEALKKSPVYEVLNESDTKNSWFALNANETGNTGNEEEEGVVDIAAIVASGRTREILDEREKEKQSGETKQAEPSNLDREFNTFVDPKNKTLEVGKQRFHGTEDLIQHLTFAIGQVIKRVDQVNRRQDCWDNVIIVGRGSTVKGFKEALLVSLQTKYVIMRNTTYSEVPSAFNTGQNTPNGTPLYAPQLTQQHNQGHGQVPTSIRLAKMAEYFPEWKGHGWEDVPFLGAQIAAKQIFTGAIESSFLTRSEYNEVGPTSIWDI